MVRPAIAAGSSVQNASAAALCLSIAFLSGYLCLTQLIVVRSDNISNWTDGDRLNLYSRPVSSGEQPVTYGFDGFIWIGSRTTPRISIESSADAAQVQVANRPVQPSCKTLLSAGGNLGQATPRIRCDIDLSGLPLDRFESLSVALSRSGVPFALNIEPAAVSLSALLFGVGALIAVLASVFLLCRAARQSWIVSAICSAGIGVRLIYWAKTPPGVRGHDVFEHFEFLTLVAQNWVRPDRNASWETHQAPLYYYIGAGVMFLERHFGLRSVGAALSSLQALSLVFSILTAIVAFLCFKQCGELFQLEAPLRERVVAMALALYLFWPTVVMDSVRIGNDSLLLLLAGIFLYCVLRWHSHSQQALVAAPLVLALAIVTKASAVLLLPVLCLVAILEWRHQIVKRVLYKHSFWLAPVLVIAGLITFGSAMNERMSGAHTSLLVAKHVPGAGFAVGNQPRNYLLFDPQKFILRPFTDFYNDEYGRQMFWHYFWKTGLFGEFRYTSRFEGLCASVLSALLLLLLASTIISILFCGLKRWKPTVSILAFAAVWIAGTVGYSILEPFAPNRDFRFAAPALIPICWLAALSSSSTASHKWLRFARCVDIALLLFIGGSIGFVTGLPSFL
jgi:hypothetical protein